MYHTRELTQDEKKNYYSSYTKDELIEEIIKLQRVIYMQTGEPRLFEPVMAEFRFETAKDYIPTCTIIQ